MITFEEVLAAKPEMIFYGAQTPWWTHKAEHLSAFKMKEKLKLLNGDGSVRKEVEPPGLPCDPRGGMLMQTDKTKEFLEAAKRAALEGKYGRHGIYCFMEAHHLNMRTPLDNWDAYNDRLDEKLKGDKIKRNRIKLCLCPYCEKEMDVKIDGAWCCEVCGVGYTEEFKKMLENIN